MSVKTPMSPRRRAAFLKSSSLTAAPICRPVAAAMASSGKRLLPVTLIAINCRAEGGICASGFWAPCATPGRQKPARTMDSRRRNLELAFVISSSSARDMRQFFCGFVLHRDVNECKRSPAERLVSAEDQRQIAAHLGVGDGNRTQNFGANVFLDVRAGDETDPDVGGYEALQQFAGIEFHGEVRLQSSLVKQLLDGIPRVSSLGDDQRKLRYVGNGGRFHPSYRMLRRSDQD